MGKNIINKTANSRFAKIIIEFLLPGMNNEQAIVFSGSKIKTKMLIFSALTLIAAFLPTVIHSQFITGPLVNMSLILATFLVGPFEAVFLGLMPSVLALTSGLLPLPLAPVVPFIMISNAILVGVYYYFGRKKIGFSILAASSLKFLFLFGIARLLAGVLLSGKAINIAILMMGWMQFFTAVAGGVLAYAVLSLVQKSRIIL